MCARRYSYNDISGYKIHVQLIYDMHFLVFYILIFDPGSAFLVCYIFMFDPGSELLSRGNRFHNFGKNLYSYQNNTHSLNATSSRIKKIPGIFIISPI